MVSDIWLSYSMWALTCALGLMLSLHGEYREKLILTAMGKLIAASAYCGAAVSVGALNSGYGRTLLVGMACCWCGDLLLVSRKNRPLFLAGLVAFLSGHIFYTAAFVVRDLNNAATLAGFILMLIFAWNVSSWLRPNLDRDMRVAVHVYIAVISIMMMAAIGSFIARTHLALLFGAALFVISDLAVARNRFIQPAFINRAWGLPVYFAAQFLLAASIYD
jgi:uncharacterized membrane protein YhhN